MNAKYLVMSSSARTGARFGNYRNVAVVETDGTHPKMISERAKGLVRIVREWRNRNVGKTDRCAYAVALTEASALAEHLNKGETE